MAPLTDQGPFSLIITSFRFQTYIPFQQFLNLGQQPSYVNLRKDTHTHL